MPSPFAFLALPFLFFVPGYLTTRALFRESDVLSPGEKIFVPVAISILVSTWIGLVLAEFGWFSMPALCLLAALYCAALWIVRRWVMPLTPGPSPRGEEGEMRSGERAGGNAPRPLSRDLSSPPRERRGGGRGWGVDWPFLAILGVGAVLAAHPAEYILGNYDASTYVNVGANIANTGAIAIHDPMAQSLPADPSRQFFWDLVNPFMLYTQVRLPGFFVADAAHGLVLPQFLHLYPVWLAIFDAALGLRLGLYATPLIGLLGGIAAYFVARTLFGRNVARLAFFLLVIAVPQFWFARYPVAEAMTQFLLLTGMYAFLRSRALTLRPDIEGQSSPLTIQGASGIGFPLVAGGSFAEIFLTRADAILLLAPLGLYALLVIFARRWRREHWAFFIAFGAVFAQAIAHMWIFSPDYIYYQYSHFLRMKNIDKLLPGGNGLPTAQDLFRNPVSLVTLVGICIAGLVALVILDRIVRVFLKRWGTRASSQSARYSSSLRWTGIGLVVVVFVLAYFIIPHPTTWYAYVGGETPLGRSANLIKLGWYLSPFGLALAVIGAAVVLRCDLDRHNAFFFGTGALFSVFYLEELYSNPHYIYTMRHYIPLVIPFLILLAARAIQFLWTLRASYGRFSPHRKRGGAGEGAISLLARAIAGGALALWLAYDIYAMGLIDASRATGVALRVPLVQDTVRLGALRLDPLSESIVGVPELGGAFDQIESLANQLAPNSVIILSNNRDEPALVATPLRFFFGRDALVSRFNQPNGDKIAALIDNWRAQGREVVLAYGTNGGKLALPGYTLAPAGHFVLNVKQWAFAYQYMPRAAWQVTLSYALYHPLPSGAGITYPFKIDFGGDDYPALVGGFLERPIGATTRLMGALPDLEGPSPKLKTLTATLRVPDEVATSSAGYPSGGPAPGPASSVRPAPNSNLDLALTVRAPKDGMRLTVKSGKSTFGQVNLTTEFATYHFTLSRPNLRHEGDSFLVELETTAFAAPDGRALGAELKEAVVSGQ